MPCLVLMRHADSALTDCLDLDRPLSPRGRIEAAAMGAHLAELIRGGLAPLSHVWISTARRTAETWAGMEPMLDGAPKAEVAPEIYSEDAPSLLAALARSPSDAATVLMIGHNPAVQVLLGDLVARERRRFVPGTQAVIEISGEWPAPGAGGEARLAAFATPASLLGG